MPEPNVNAPKAQSAPATSDTKWAVASLVCGILGVVTMYFGVIFGILAIVFAHKQKKIQPNGMATAGFVLGIIGIVIGLFLGLLMVIGAMAYFGALNPDSFLPEKCTAIPPFSCATFGAQGDALAVTYENNAGKDLEQVTVSASGCTPTVEIGTVPAGGSVDAQFTCEPVPDGLRNAEITISYVEDGLAKSGTGTVQVRVA